MAWFEDGWFNSRWFEAEMTKFNPQIWDPDVFNPDVWDFGTYAEISTVNRTASIIGRGARYTGDVDSTTPPVPPGTKDLRFFKNSADKLFAWDNNKSAWKQMVKQRLHGMRNSKWVLCRYIWLQAAVDGTVVTNAPEYGVPTQAQVEAYWTGLGKGLDSTDGTGLYIHNGSPESDSNRTHWSGSANYLWIKFAEPAMLDYFFGPEDGDPTTGWVYTNYPTSYFDGKILEPCDYYGHDVFNPWVSYGLHDGTYYPYTGNAAELRYSVAGYYDGVDGLKGEGGAHTRWIEFLTAFKERFLDPLGRKLIFNLSQIRHTKGNIADLYPYGNTVDYQESDFTEYFDGYFLEDLILPDDPWTGRTGTVTDYRWDLETKLNAFATLLSQGKSVAAVGGRYDVYAFKLHNTDSSSRKYQVFGNTLRLANSGGNVDITLTNYSSVDDLVDYINTEATIDYWEADIDYTGTTVSCSLHSQSPPNLREVAEQTVNADTWTNMSTTAPVSPSYQASPRDYMLSQFAFLLLLGVRSTDNVFLGQFQNAMSCSLDAHSDIHDLLPLLGEPDSRQTTWEKVNEAWGDVYCRRYENGVVFFNWETVGTEARTINASDFTSPWYAVSDHVYTPGETWNGSTSISLSPHCGEICIYSIG